MSLEAKIEDLTAAIHALVAAMAQRPTQAPAAQAPAPAPTPVAPAPAPVVSAPPAPAAASPSSAMPAPPVFAAPAPAPVASGAPFTDAKGLIGYVMESYKTLGPAKGAQIQQVLVSLGYQNINDVKAEHYGALFAGVEALKG